MRLLGRNILQALYGRDGLTDKWLTNWTAEVCSATWKYPDDVIRQFPQARFREPSYIVFPIGADGGRISLIVMFSLGIAVVSDFESHTTLNFNGT